LCCTPRAKGRPGGKGASSRNPGVDPLNNRLIKKDLTLQRRVE
jgi:hypothetical protein